MNIHKAKYMFWAVYGMLDLGANTALAYDIPNPINAGSFADVVYQLVYILTIIASPIAVLFLMYAGLLFVTARGSEEQLKKAKGVFFYTIIGVAILVGAYAIASAVVNFAEQL
mgnify:CR=1 FL=1